MASEVKQTFPGKAQMDVALESVRSTSDYLRATLAVVEDRLKTGFVAADDDEICYRALWIKRVRQLIEEVDTKLGHLKRLTAMQASHLWLRRPEPESYVKKFGHGFQLSLGLLPSLPKKGTPARASLIKWLQDGGRSDCLVMDEPTGEWVFDYEKMTELVNTMVEQGMPVPDTIKTSADTKLIVRSLNA